MLPPSLLSASTTCRYIDQSEQLTSLGWTERTVKRRRKCVLLSKLKLIIFDFRQDPSSFLPVPRDGPHVMATDERSTTVNVPAALLREIEKTGNKVRSSHCHASFEIKARLSRVEGIPITEALLQSKIFLAHTERPIQVFGPAT